MPLRNLCGAQAAERFMTAQGGAKHGLDHGSTLTVTIVNVSRGEITTVHVGTGRHLVPHASRASSGSSRAG